MVKHLLLSRYLLITLFIISGYYSSTAQKKPSDKELLDSLIANDPFLRELDSASRPRSYATISIGAGNKLFSTRNSRLNTLQSEGKLVVSPSFSYFHKSGLGLTATGNLLSDNGKFSLYQSSITPSYDYLLNKNFSFGISYTRYFVDDKFSFATSPVKNDFYGYAVYKKPWIEPFIAIGYATGSFNEVVHYDTMIGPNRIIGVDSSETDLRSLSLTTGIEHPFEWYGVFSNKDGLSVMPQLLANFGSDTYKTTYTSSTTTVNLRNRKSKRVSRYSEDSDNSNLRLLSLAFALSTQYAIGKFTFKPYCYFDYYLPETTTKKLTTFVSVSLGYTF